MTIKMTTGVVRISCGRKPLDTPYLPPASDLAELGRYLARRYADSDEPKGEETA